MKAALSCPYIICSRAKRTPSLKMDAVIGWLSNTACSVQGIYPLPYWTGIIVFHAIYAGFELKRFQNFNKYGEVTCLFVSQLQSDAL